MSSSGASQNTVKHPASLETGSFIFRNLIKDVPLAAEGEEQDVKITCIELWNNNLYIGTTAAEILHFVGIPPDPDDDLGQPSFILASRLQPPALQNTGDGVQQILLLPRVGKACILCNGSLSFYTLPELSPAFNRLKPISCVWVGGIDQDEDQEQGSAEDGMVVMLCLKTKLRLVKIGEEPVRVRDIEFGGCQATARRGDFACAADNRSYALLDVVNQQKIPLTTISSLDDQTFANDSPAEDLLPLVSSHGASRSVSTTAGRPESTDSRGHSRSTSLGIFQSGQPPQSPRQSSLRHGFDVPEALNRSLSPQPRGALSPERPGSQGPSFERSRTPDKPLPATPQGGSSRRASPAKKKTFLPLKPHIASLTSTEFLLTTGTAPSEPGLGMIVNLDGDVVRDTLEFTTYPYSLVVEGAGVDLTNTSAEDAGEEGFVLAALRRTDDDQLKDGIEVQRWDLDPGEGAKSKEWLDLPTASSNLRAVTDTTAVDFGVKSAISKSDISLPEVIQKLALKRLPLQLDRSFSANTNTLPDAAAEERRAKEESEFVSRFSKVPTRTLLWVNDRIYWIVRSSMILQLDSRLTAAESTDAAFGLHPDRQGIQRLVNDLRGKESQNEVEFLALGYIRQKAALLLFMDVVIRTSSRPVIPEKELRATEEALVSSDIDPRVVLSLVPVIRNEIDQGSSGIWIPGGIRELIDNFKKQHDVFKMPADTPGPFGDNILQLMRRYLLFWRHKKGFGSVADSTHVFNTVDAALVHVLLLLDQRTPRGPASAGTVRAELNAVVDNGIDCFDRGIQLLEQFKRLYVLSRLYQSKKQASNVLATWRRILDGEEDLGGDFIDGENELRKYLTKIRDKNVMKEYGTWLANRRPKLGVQVFADDHSRVTFAPSEALELLRERAPAAVKEYLEYLVFGKKQTQHANELIAYYLNIVIDELRNEDKSRAVLLSTYETYRALRPPKPTYRQFISDNAIDAEWWRSRLRLLQLLGSSQGAASSYDVPEILERLKPYEQEMVPEMIILNGRQGRHEEAIRLLTHGLGDFDTAISYCLLGGSSIFRSVDGTTSDRERPSREEQAKLFNYLLHEFFRIEDLTDRIERTSELLERFGGWFDVEDVLDMIPDGWSLSIFSSFLANSVRRLVKERSETTVAKALSGAVNLRVAAEMIDKVEAKRPVIENAT